MNLKNVRKSLGLTQKDVATVLGVTPQTIISIEKSKYRFPIYEFRYRKYLENALLEQSRRDKGIYNGIDPPEIIIGCE